MASANCTQYAEPGISQQVDLENGAGADPKSKFEDFSISQLRGSASPDASALMLGRRADDNESSLDTVQCAMIADKKMQAAFGKQQLASQPIIIHGTGRVS
jgi:hypothetical protein